MSLFAHAVSADDAPVIVVLGDSLSAGYGMNREESWAELLRFRLQENGYPYSVLNSSVSGDTTQGGLSRLPRLLDRYQPKIIIIELGGNDGLRGLEPDITRQNISDMVRQSQANGALVVVTGIKLPPNYGAAYLEQFESIYADIADEYDTLLVPFIMEGVVFTPGMLQADGIHPSARAQPILLENVWRILEPELRKYATTN